MTNTFFDERINTECGKIYRRGILYATLVTLFYGTLRGIYLASIGQFFVRYLYTELTVVLCGFILLTVGAIKFPKNGDERSAFERHNYFLGAGKLFIVATLAGYAVTIPFSREKSFGDMPINHIIFVLEVLGYIYFFYTFKTRGISFNYSVISEERSTYYKAVFANIGKLAGVLFVAFAFAAFLDLGVNQSLLGFLGILWSYLVSVVSLSLEYLFISWVEKRSYDEQNSDRMASGTVIAFLLLIATAVFYAAFHIAYVFIATGNLSAFPGNVGETLASLASGRVLIGYSQSALTAVVWCSLLAQIDNPPRCRRALWWVLALSVFSILWHLATSFFSIIATPFLETALEPYQMRNLLELISGFSSCISLVGIAFNGWLSYTLVKDVNVSGAILLSPALSLAVYLADLFFTSQSMARTSAILGSAVSFAALLVTFAVLNNHKISPIFTEDAAE